MKRDNESLPLKGFVAMVVVAMLAFMAGTAVGVAVTKRNLGWAADYEHRQNARFVIEFKHLRAEEGALMDELSPRLDEMIHILEKLTGLKVDSIQAYNERGQETTVHLDDKDMGKK
jgi:hypothetical protein